MIFTGLLLPILECIFLKKENLKMLTFYFVNAWSMCMIYVAEILQHYIVAKTARKIRSCFSIFL